jgi:hypothetical protein
MACKIGNDTLGQRALVEPVVDQAHVGSLQMRFVRGRAASSVSVVPRSSSPSLLLARGLTDQCKGTIVRARQDGRAPQLVEHGVREIRR